MPEALKIGLHPTLTPSAPEVKYVFRTLLNAAGYGCHFCRADGQPVDIYYGPGAESAGAAVSVSYAGLPFDRAASAEPQAFYDGGGLGFIAFDTARPAVERSDSQVRIGADIIFASYWLLTGCAERDARRDSSDNLDLGGSFLLTHGLLSRPLVSEYAAFLREYFRSRGRQPLDLPWQASGAQAAIAFSHDVDYPQMIRGIEALRLLRDRGLRAWPSIRGVLSGTNHFWKFRDWVEWEKSLGARSAFYFSARRGSLLQYAAGTPDCFYDVRAREFRELFKQLNDEGCEVGLHASYHAHRSAEQLRAERELLEAAAGSRVEGNRHHYWHLDPAAPHETLLRHEAAGFAYDTSLAFEFYPGWRRGVCHPFHAYHPGKRREIKTLQLPPAWMDDHFHRRRAKNGIADPNAHARGLLKVARSHGGIVVLDYHVRGMNSDFFPEYGAWLMDFMRNNVDSSLRFMTPRDIARAFAARESSLLAHSLDTFAESAVSVATAAAAPVEDFAVGRIRRDELAEVARMHFEFFGADTGHGHSVANLGANFLEQVFYRANADNPYFFVDVARYRGEIIAFSVYASDGHRVFRETLRRHPVAVAGGAMKVALRHPGKFLRRIIGNLQFFNESRPEVVRDIRGWYFLLGVKPAYRTREFKQRTGIWLAGELWQHMEKSLAAAGCDRFWTVVGAHNGPMNELHKKMQMQMVAQGTIQGLPSNYYVKELTVEPAAQAETLGAAVPVQAR